MKKKLLSLLLAIYASIGVALADASGTCGRRLEWSYNSTTHALTITGSGAMLDWSSQQPVPWYSYRSEITSVSLPNGLTSIGNNAFYKCSGLTSVTIPNSVTRIGHGAFENCSSLTSVTIPESVTHIGNSAFRYCSGLTSVTIGNSVTSIGQYAFAGCTGLTSIDIPNSVTNIEICAFKLCTSLTSVTISNRMTSIESNLFYGCTRLTSVTIGNSVRSIDNTAFSGCTGITNVIWNARQCNDFDQTPFMDSREQFCNFEFGEVVEKIPAYLCYGMINLTSVTIPNSVTSIGDDAFCDCPGLTSVTIGNSVTSIGKHAFYCCTGLTSVTIGNSVTSIGDNAFSYCRGLTSVTIPNSVTSIGDFAFANCTSLTSVTTLMDNPPVINNTVFKYCGILSAIYCFVPRGSLSLYQNANVWRSFRLIGIEEATVIAEETTATITAPFSIGNVASYSLVLYNHGEVFCILTLDAEGHLIGVNFAHSQHRVVAFDSSVTGLSIPITGLQPGTTYTFTLDALNSNGNIIERHIGEFTTEGTTALENVSAEGANGVRKVIEDGKVIILMPDGRRFDASGKLLK